MQGVVIVSGIVEVTGFALIDPPSWPLYSLPPASPIEIVRHLMEANELRQADMVDVFGTARVVSEVLSEKRSGENANRESEVLMGAIAAPIFASMPPPAKPVKLPLAESIVKV